jgi:hypothetical protein
MAAGPLLLDKEESYASGVPGGGRCCRAWPKKWDAGKESYKRTPLRGWMGGSADWVPDPTNPLGPIPPKVRRPQSLSQDVLESAGPAGCPAFAWWWQHLPRVRQQDELEKLNDWASSGAREAKESSKARHPATMGRATRKLYFLPGILGGSIYHTRDSARLKIRTKPARSGAVETYHRLRTDDVPLDARASIRDRQSRAPGPTPRVGVPALASHRRP